MASFLLLGDILGGLALMPFGVRWLAVLALVVGGGGCQGSSTSSGPPSEPTTHREAVLAAEALERGEYASAAELYQRALAAEPGNLALHYGLGVSASYLAQRALAVRELMWVLKHGEAGSDGVNAARRWLLAAGALPGPVTAPVSASVAKDSETHDRDAGRRPGSVHGRAMLGDVPGAVAPMVRMQVFLKEYPAAVNYFRLRTDERGYFHFENVPPGIYQLTERVAGPPTWRLRVEVRPGEDVTRDLTPENSTKVRDDFPGPT